MPISTESGVLSSFTTPAKGVVLEWRIKTRRRTYLEIVGQAFWMSDGGFRACMEIGTTFGCFATSCFCTRRSGAADSCLHDL